MLDANPTVLIVDDDSNLRASIARVDFGISGIRRA
jgi:hypothetical protein